MCVYLGKTNAKKKIPRAVCAVEMPLHFSIRAMPKCEMEGAGSRRVKVGREGSSPALTAQVQVPMVMPWGWEGEKAREG